MSNQINPFNYNIDNFDSGFLGPISDTNFRNFLFTHSLTSVNPIVGGILGGNPLADRGTEYDIAQSTFNVIDIPNLTDVAVQPSFYNNLTEPRPDNLDRNLQQINQQVVDNTSVSSTNPDQEGRNVDAATLLNINPTIIDLPGLKEVSNTPSFYNNFTNPKQDNLDFNPTKDELISWYPYQNYINILNQEYDTYNTDWTVPTTLRIGYVGNVDEWVLGGNIVTTSDVRDRGYYMLNNVYGPKDIIQYYTSNNKRENNSSVVEQLDEVLTQGTGFKQYNTKVSGDFRDALLSRSLGVGIIPFSEVSSGINYEPIEGEGPSELDKEARKRRGIELKNRIQLNFVDDTLGIVNTNVFGLLAGGTLLNRDFSITRPKSTLGKVADFIANLTGFNYPKSILQDSDVPFTWSSPKQQVPNAIRPSNINEIDVSEGLLDRTGKATRELIIDTTDINKYGPNFGGKYEEYNDGTYLSSDPNLISKQENKKGPIPNISGDIDGDTQEGGFYGRNETPIKTSFSEATGFDSPENNPDIINPENFSWNPDDLPSFTIPSIGTFELDNKRSKTPFRKGLLKYTQDIVNKSNADLNKLGGYIGYFDSQKSKGTDGKHKTGSPNPGTPPTLPSKGNQVRNISITKNGDTITPIGGDVYCRSWAPTNKFGKNGYQDLVRSGPNWWRNAGNLPKINGNSLLTLNYLGDSSPGVPKMAWTSEDKQKFKDQIGGESKAKGMMIPYMFSIENLAWKNSVQYRMLPPSEKGPNEGRIMWFPPYGLNFSESNSVNWDPTNFIGRGEPIYTYNHSERSGSLDFMIVVDHPSVLNNIRDNFVSKIRDPLLQDNVYHSFFAGCNIDDLKEIFKPYVNDDSEITDDLLGFTPDETQYDPIKPTEPNPPPYQEIRVYFENCKDSKVPEGRDFDYDVVQNRYEIDYSSISTDDGLIPICNPADGLNLGVEDKLKELAEFLVGAGKYEGDGSGKNYKINVIGYTSPSNPESGFNQKLGKDRADSLFSYLNSIMELSEPIEGVKLDCGEGCNEYYPLETDIPFNDRWEVKSQPSDAPIGSDCPNSVKVNGRCPSGNPCSTTPLEDGQANSKTAKTQRYVSIKLVKNLNLQSSLLKKINDQNKPKFLEEQELKNQQQRDVLKTDLVGKYITEMDYFSELERTSPFLYETLHEKIQNFHPAFHSMTPEGLNSRLTFLLQCTRQGPQLIDTGDNPQNMVFGRPPICILRIGDFYHTKIVIDSVNINYEPLQWDLNPEGIGVQPMIAKVSMGFKFIGGSSLGGPIQQLQNAVSYNFFANTGVYQKWREVVDKEVENKQKIVYGAFITPTEADEFYGTTNNTNQSVNNNKNAVSQQSANNNTSSAGADNQLKTETSTEAGKNLDSTTQATDGNNKPPTQEATNQSNSIATVTITPINDIQISIVNNKWVISSVDISTIDVETGVYTFFKESYTNNETWVNITNSYIKQYITSEFTDVTVLDGYPNVNCRYDIRVKNKNSDTVSVYDGDIIIKL